MTILKRRFDSLLAWERNKSWSDFHGFETDIDSKVLTKRKAFRIEFCSSCINWRNQNGRNIIEQYNVYFEKTTWRDSYPFWVKKNLTSRNETPLALFSSKRSIQVSERRNWLALMSKGSKFAKRGDYFKKIRLWLKSLIY